VLGPHPVNCQVDQASGRAKSAHWPSIGGCDRLHSPPTAPVGIPAATLAILVRAQVELLRTLLGTIAELKASIATRVAAYPRAQLLTALPGVGTINLAQLLAEVGPILDRVANAEQAATEGGAAPSPELPARPPASISAGPPTGGPARPYADARAAANATRTPPGSSLVPGSGSSGPAGTPAPHMTHAHLAEQRLAVA
jgi:hypothetical protein